MIIRLSGPLKECYARDHGLDFQQMLSASDYKEKYCNECCDRYLHSVTHPRYRLDMINWSTKIRQEDYTYFCKAAINKYEADRSAKYKENMNKPHFICSDLVCGL